MTRFIFYFTVLVTGLCMQFANAQTQDSLPKTGKKLSKDQLAEIEYQRRRKEDRLNDLKEEKEDIVSVEKYNLAQEVERINSVLESGKITAEEAKLQKEQAAKIAALNIDNKTAIIENQLVLAERDNTYNFQYKKGAYIAIGFGNANDDMGSALLGVEFNNEKQRMRFDKRTYSDVVLAYGYNNTIKEHQSINHSPYEFKKSGFLEIGYTLRTRLLKNSNTFRAVYGVSLQLNELHTDDNKYFENDNGQTILVDSPNKLKVSKMRFTDLVVPLYLEFGPSKKIEKKDYFRYSTQNKFKAGLGGFAGFNLGTMQKLKYKEDGETIKTKLHQEYNTTSFVYGLGGYVGFGAMSLYVKYNLNPLFKNNSADERTISAGLRFDL